MTELAKRRRAIMAGAAADHRLLVSVYNRSMSQGDTLVPDATVHPFAAGQATTIYMDFQITTSTPGTQFKFWQVYGDSHRHSAIGRYSAGTTTLDAWFDATGSADFNPLSQIPIQIGRYRMIMVHKADSPTAKVWAKLDNNAIQTITISKSSYTPSDSLISIGAGIAPTTTGVPAGLLRSFEVFNYAMTDGEAISKLQ